VLFVICSLTWITLCQRLSITHKGKKRLSEKAHHRENANLSEVPNFGALYEKNTPKQEVKHVNFAVTENDHSTQCRDSDSDGVKESKKENRIASFSRKKSNKKMKHSSEKNRKKTSPTTKEFKCATTSSASMTDLISKVTKVLKKEDIKSEQDGLIFKCGTPAVNFEIELVTLSKLPVRTHHSPLNSFSFLVLFSSVECVWVDRTCAASNSNTLVVTRACTKKLLMISFRN
jgi:DNA polymerase III alpha subunit (gram-positive type)